MDNGPTPLESGQARVLHSFSSEPPLETWRSCIAVAKHKEKPQHKILTRVSHHRCSAANSSGHIACHLQDVAVHGSLQSYCSSFVLGIMHHAQPPQGKPHPCRLAHSCQYPALLSPPLPRSASWTRALRVATSSCSPASRLTERPLRRLTRLGIHAPDYSSQFRQIKP